MPGIADVQPKAIEQIGYSPDLPPVIQPISWDRAQAPEFSAALQAWNQARASGSQAQVARQQAAEFTSPEQIAARQAQTSFAGASASQQEANLSGADAEAAFSRYNPNPPLGKDGKVDHVAKREMGMNYLRAEWMGTYAQAGLTPSHTIPTVNKNGQTVNVYKNAFGENVYDEAIQSKYQKMWGKATEIKMSAGKTDSWATPGDLSVADENSPPASSSVIPDNTPPSYVSGTISPEGAPVSTDVAPGSITPAMVMPTSNQPVVVAHNDPIFSRIAAMSQAGKPVVLGQPGNPFAMQANLDAFRAGQASAGAAPVVLPNEVQNQPDVQALPMTPGVQPAAPKPTIITTSDSRIAVTPIVQPAAPSVLSMTPTPLGMGIPSGFSPGYSPQEQTAALRASELYKNWAEKSGAMGRFRAAAASYTGQSGEITTQKDIALANSALQLQMPGGGGSGGRGNPDMQVHSLEAAQPLLEQFYGLKAKILKTKLFEEGTRKRLIELGHQSVAALEDPARGAVQMVAKNLRDANVDPNGHLYPYELGLLNGGGAPGATGAKQVKTVTLPGRGKIDVEY
jgi:hypothetical protein